MAQHPARSPRRPLPRRRALSAALLALALLLSGCSWFSGDDEAPVTEATPAPVEQPDPDVEVIGADDVEVGDPVSADPPGQGIYFVSSLYDLSGPDLDQPVLVRMVLDSGLPEGTPVAVATRADEDAPWDFLEGRLDDDRRHVEFIVSTLGTFGVLAVDSSSIAGRVTDQVTSALEADAEKPEGAVAPTCASTQAAREAGYTARSWKRSSAGWCLDLLGEEPVLRVTNLRGVPVRVTAPGGLDRGETGESLRAAVPWEAWIEAVGASAEAVPGDSTDALLAPGRTLSIDATLDPGSQLMTTVADDERSRTVQVLHASAQALSAQVRAFGVREGAVPPAGRVLERWLDTRSCTQVLGQGARALARGCLGERALTRAYGSVALLLGPATADPAVTRVLREQLAALGSDAAQVEQRIEVSREEPDFGPLVGRFAGTDRVLSVAADGTVTESFGRDGKPVISMTYRLSEPRADGTRATATLTSVTVRDRKQLNGAVPRVGQTGTLVIKRGVVTPPFLRTTYCDAERAAQGVCTDPAPEAEAATD